MSEEWSLAVLVSRLRNAWRRHERTRAKVKAMMGADVIPTDSGFLPTSDVARQLRAVFAGRRGYSIEQVQVLLSRHEPSLYVARGDRTGACAFYVKRVPGGA
jgi:DICT domain-containing protein